MTADSAIYPRGFI